MANKNAIPPEAYKWKPGQSGNPSGTKKGSKHLSTWIQQMLTDETFSFSDKEGNTLYEGAPVQAIIGVAIYQAMLGRKDAREWLAKHGYGLKINLEGEDPVVAALRRMGLLNEEEMGDANAGQDQRTTETTS